MAGHRDVSEARPRFVPVLAGAAARANRRERRCTGHWPSAAVVRRRHSLAVRLSGLAVTAGALWEGVELGRGAAFQPPTPEGVLAGLQAERKLLQAVFRRMVDDGILVKVKEDIFLHREHSQQLRERVLAHFQTRPSINVGAMKDLFGVSRKYAIPFLEHLDDVRITRRQGDERVPYK